MGMDTLSREATVPILNGLLQEEQILPFRVDPFQKEGKTILTELPSLKVYQFHLSRQQKPWSKSLTC